MLNKYDFKYILKRVLVFICVGFIMSFISSCEAHAMEYATISPNNRQCSDAWSCSFNFNNIYDNRGDMELIGQLQYQSTANYPQTMLPLNVRLRTMNDTQYVCDIGNTYGYNDTGADTYIMTIHCKFKTTENNGLKNIYFETQTNYGFLFYLQDITLIWGYNDSTQVANAVNEVNNSINNSSVDTGSSGGAFGNMEQSQAQNGTISSLVLMPITLLQSILNGFNGSCSGVNLGTIFDYEFILPCINPQDYIGIIWNIIDTICAGFIAYSIGKRMVVIFNNLTNLRDGGLAEAYD